MVCKIARSDLFFLLHSRTVLMKLLMMSSVWILLEYGMFHATRNWFDFLPSRDFSLRRNLLAWPG